MKYSALVLAVAAVLMAPAAAAQSPKANPGLVSPNSPLYGLETAWDNVAVGVGLKSAGDVALERAAEARKMAEQNNTRGMERAAEQLSRVANRSRESDSEALDQAIASLEEARQSAPEEAQQGLSTALEKVREARRNAGRARDRSASDGTPAGPGQQTPGQEPPETPSTNETLETGDRTDQRIPESGSGTADRSETSSRGTGSFTLLVSDAPADISDFDYLNVEFDRARIFRSGADGTGANDSMMENETMEMGDELVNDTVENDTEMEENNTVTNSGSVTRRNTRRETNVQRNRQVQTTGNDTPEYAVMERSGFYEAPLNGTTVDLTQVVGERAARLTELELDAGTYSKVELYSSSINASVNGSSVDVKVPPGKLMINKPFEVVENESTEFVFDIHVALRGNQRNNQGYILRPTISESGTEVEKQVDESISNPSIEQLRADEGQLPDY